MSNVQVVTLPSSGVPTPDVTGVLAPAPTQNPGGTDTYLALNGGCAISTQNLGASGGALFNRMHMTLVYIPASLSIKSILCEVTTLGTGVVRFGFAAHNLSTGKPGTLEYDFGGADVTGTGFKELTLAATLRQGWHWLLWAWQGTNTTGPILRSRTNSNTTLCANASNAFSVTTSWFQSGITGAFANPVPENYGSLADQPALLLRKA